MTEELKKEIRNNIKNRVNLRSLFINIKRDSYNGTLLSLNQSLYELKFSSLINGNIEDIWFYLHYLYHTNVINLEELSYLIEPLKKSEPYLIQSDSIELNKLILDFDSKIDKEDLLGSIKTLIDPKDNYKNYVLQRTLFKYNYYLDLHIDNI